MAEYKQVNPPDVEETPLPEGWRKAVTPDRKKQFYYVNQPDRFTTWEDPRIYNPEPVKQVQSSWEYIIRTFQFVNANQSDKERQHQELNNHHKFLSQLGSEEILKACLNALQEQICVQNFPLPLSIQEVMVENVIEELQRMIKVCVGNGRMGQKPCQDLLFQFILRLLQSGPGSSVCYIISEKLIKDNNMGNYLENLTVDQLTIMIDSLRAWRYVPEDPTQFVCNSQSFFWRECTYNLVKRILESSSDDNYNKVAQSLFLDLYLFYFTKMVEVPDDFLVCLKRVTDRIDENIPGNSKKNPYQVLRDQNTLRRHWQTVGDIICMDQFDDYDLHFIKDIVYNIIKCISKNDWFVAFLDDIVYVMKRYFLTDHGGLHKVFKDILSLLKSTSQETYKENPQIVSKMLGMFLEVLREKPTYTEWVYDYLTALKSNCTPRKGSEEPWLQLMVMLMKGLDRFGVDFCERIVGEQKFKKIWNWKKNYQAAIDIIEPTKDVHLDRFNKEKRLLRDCSRLIDDLLGQLKLAKVNEKLHGHMAELCITCMEKRTDLMSNFARGIVHEITLEGNQEVIPGLIQRYKVLFYDSEFMLENEDNWRCGSDLLEKFVEAYSNGNQIPEEVDKTLVEMFLWAMETEDLEYQDMGTGYKTIYGRATTDCLLQYTRKHFGRNKADRLLPLVPVIIKQMKHEEKDLKDMSRIIIGLMAMDDYSLLRGHLGALVEWYKEAQCHSSLRALWKPLEESDGFTAKDFSIVMEAISEDSANSKAYIQGQLLKLMADKQPELFTREHIDMMIRRFVDDQHSQPNVLTAVAEIIECKPEIFGAEVISLILQNQNLDVKNASSLHTIAVNLGLQKKELVNTIFEELIGLAKCWHDPNHQIFLLDAVRILGCKYGMTALKPHRKYFEDLQKHGMSTPVKEAATALVNAMDGVSMEGIITEVIQTKRKIKDLDEKVQQVKTEVSGVKSAVANQKEQVEEDDKKEQILSNAPAWSKDLSKLMNPKSEHDWQALAKRLGYTQDNIKTWAKHSDPCSALLNEKFATQKKMEATKAVLDILQDMNRLDAAVIVENAMKASQEDVKKEAPEYKKPPPIFLSYHWANQKEVKLLRQHLLKAGYECWLDVGQMGSGDKLLDKIDSGIRGAKVVICCVSKEYTQSPNCDREVKLSASLGKPMIPLMMEKMGWPLQGTMGPIISENLFIRFFRLNTEDTKDQCYWPISKFLELLMQLNMYNTMPDESLITNEYKNWWLPVAEDTEGQSSSGGSGDKDKESTTPDVFLSYQWSKQKQARRLYKRLSDLGLTCWIDIYQMGGGGSMYDKIDRAVRGCKVFLACVSNKYTLSANCRREASLANTFQKLGISLLLEKINWPTSGPMSNVIAKFPSVDFDKEEVQMTLTGDEFDLLLAEIREIIPATTRSVKDDGRRESNSQGNTRDEAGGSGTAQEVEGASNSQMPSTSNQTGNPGQRHTSGEESKAAQAQSVEEGEETEGEPPPSYDSLFIKKSSGSKMKPSALWLPQSSKAKPSPPPYLYLHHFVKTPDPRPPTPEAETKKKKKSSTCVIA